MTAKRYSGNVAITLEYRESDPGETYANGTPRHPNGSYRCTLVRTEGKHKIRETVNVGAPIVLSTAVDSPEAFTAAARAAIAFGDRGWGEACAFDAECRGYHLGTSPAKAWPPRP